jgi:hypothetical protein
LGIRSRFWPRSSWTTILQFYTSCSSWEDRHIHHAQLFPLRWCLVNFFILAPDSLKPWSSDLSLLSKYDYSLESPCPVEVLTFCELRINKCWENVKIGVGLRKYTPKYGILALRILQTEGHWKVLRLPLSDLFLSSYLLSLFLSWSNSWKWEFLFLKSGHRK